MAKDVCLIIGLGNPGEKYARTRHNAGFEVLERLADQLGVSLRKKLLLRGAVAEVADGERKLVLCEPQTFMNNSGDCVRRVISRYDVPRERTLVIYDDIDLPPGKIRIRKAGGPGTHNGMRSIAQCLGDTDFPRLRVGTGDRPAGEDLVAWVLGRPGGEDREKMEAAFGRAAEAALVFAREGVEKAMQKGNVG